MADRHPAGAWKSVAFVAAVLVAAVFTWSTGDLWAASQQKEWSKTAEENFYLAPGTGDKLLDEKEWQTHQQKLNSMNTEEQHAYRKEMHKKLMSEAKEKGIKLPERGPDHGKKAGSASRPVLLFAAVDEGAFTGSSPGAATRPDEDVSAIDPNRSPGSPQPGIDADSPMDSGQDMFQDRDIEPPDSTMTNPDLDRADASAFQGNRAAGDSNHDMMGEKNINPERGEDLDASPDMGAGAGADRSIDQDRSLSGTGEGFDQQQDPDKEMTQNQDQQAADMDTGEKKERRGLFDWLFNRE